MNCSCGAFMDLMFSVNNKRHYSFSWRCQNFPDCSFTKTYTPVIPALDIANTDTMTVVNCLKKGSLNEKELMIDEIRTQMVKILEHFIICGWGAHYNTLLHEIIQPYLDCPNVLHYVLTGPSIKTEKGNVFLGSRGAKMFPELLDCFKGVKNSRISTYLNEEFNCF